ncbi:MULTISPECIES: cbb3-type cytochrome c oxidase subunit 3 [Sphingopyxis]|jgi:cytochrome c oxidase cbb3-type subunit 4|uniref:Cytochrome C oxidase Cbb3 n=1 Tax=Sphingopyxis macrogoltabida TaxID=33050 RepID=A0AAC9FGF6_SPHMC|nr:MULTISPECIES: cbb3-type cytochrome c oxidase subunit 3 [Sphingopyxis]ALJ15251.1 Cbb3-type cytochrome oxidase subunit 3 [Sphingopyxis macrogoltabida]AMU91496.1 cytochrome C oxidase Cbb3 [Sphingopyxis macrogoltabida]KTE03811.1 cytochrome C oxidase Cbb3 [Sphingopyxis sp. H012]KTE09273.1 cytochrome C oxidase Cbb3 [Sphingopyxis sp. H053]KTE13734.1 cytochrome C oxidase Cbb3 [Sphingopyxis sp. H115]
MSYDALRHFADSWGLLAMALLFLTLIAWPFRPSARARNEEAANMIFKDDEHG